MRPPKLGSEPLGLCWWCGAYGQLATTCTASKLYPLSQSVVKTAEVPNMYTQHRIVNEVAAEPTTCDEGVDGALANW